MKPNPNSKIFFKRRRSGKKPTNFNPTREQVSAAVADFLKSGGSIHREVNYNFDTNMYPNFSDLKFGADDFLMGR